MTKLIAKCQITRTPNNSPATELAGYDDNGNPIIKAVAEHIMPGALFEEPNPAEEAWLRAQDAVRDPTDLEVEMAEKAAVRA